MILSGNDREKMQILYNPHSGKNLRLNTKNYNNINQLNSFLTTTNKNVVHKNPGNLSLKINELRI